MKIFCGYGLMGNFFILKIKIRLFFVKDYYLFFLVSRKMREVSGFGNVFESYLLNVNFKMLDYLI